MAKFTFGIQSTAITFASESAFDEDAIPKIMEALAADPLIGFVETQVSVPRLDSEGQPILDDQGTAIVDIATQRNPATPEQLADAFGKEVQAWMLAKVNSYHLAKAQAQALSVAESAYTPISATPA